MSERAMADVYCYQHARLLLHMRRVRTPSDVLVLVERMEAEARRVGTLLAVTLVSHSQCLQSRFAKVNFRTNSH